MGVFVLQILEFEIVYVGFSIEEFIYVVIDIVEVILDCFVGVQVFLSYFGGGMFVCVGVKVKLLFVDVMYDEFVMMLNDLDLVYCEEVQMGFIVIIGDVVVFKFFEKCGDFCFFDCVVEKFKEVGGVGCVVFVV